jgi:hypothetical protein
MGAWETGIFDDDLALDVKEEFTEALREGLSVQEATEQILESYEDALEDEEEAGVIYFALAELQMKKRKLQSEIKQRALDLIERDQDVERWKDTEEFNKRKSVLEDLKNRLLKS